MGIECPKCNFDNPDDTVYCGKCATPLPSSGEVSVTKTLETLVEGLKRGATFAGRYEIIEELGTGGMGKVYRVKDEKLDEEMALKVLKPEIATNKGMIERFKNELKLARKIAHRSVCKMYDLNEEEGTHFITMEYVTGENLKSYIRKKGKISEEDAIYIAKQVCEGLGEAHELGVIHRDLKPQNIMIDKKSNAKVMDFGIARSVEAPGVTQTGVMIGTPDYISPEQAEGKEADQRSDIYALGVILYEMVTGSVPFKGDTALSVALKHKTQLPQDPRKLNPDVSDDLSRLILICMEKDKERRYQTAEELLADLRNIEEGFPLGTKVRPRRKTFIAASIRKKLFIPALAVFILVVVIAFWRFLLREKPLPIPPDKSSLAVMYFKNNTGDRSLDHWRSALCELLITDLSQSKFIKILSAERLFHILSRLNQLEATTYSSRILAEVAAQGGVKNILVGSYMSADGIFRINVTLQDGRTGEIIDSEIAEGKGEKSFFPMVDELTIRIKENLKISQREIADDFDETVESITTSSTEAYKHYIEGRRLHNIGDYTRSIGVMQKATKIDPQFAMAYRSVSSSFGNIGWQPASRQAMQKAYELRDWVSERERYLILGDYFRKSSKTFAQAIEAYKKLLKIYPDDGLANSSIGLTYFNLEEFDKAIEHYEKRIKIGQKEWLPHFNLAISYESMGFYDKTISILRELAKEFPEDPRFLRKIAMEYLLEGKYALAMAELGKILSLYSSDPVTQGWAIEFRGDFHLLNGDFSQAEQEYLKFVQGSQKRRIGLTNLYVAQGKFVDAENLLGQKPALNKPLAFLYLRTEKAKDAMKEFDKALSDAVKEGNTTQQMYFLHAKGIAHLQTGSEDKALRSADELKALIESGLNKKIIRLYYHLVGMIELSRDKHAKAIKLLSKAFDLLTSPRVWFPNIHALFLDHLARAYYEAGKRKKAEEAYKKIQALAYARLGYGDIYARSFFMLGKIYERQKKRDKAIEHYAKFLDLWKDADPGIAEVEDGRKRLAGLKEMP